MSKLMYTALLKDNKRWLVNLTYGIRNPNSKTIFHSDRGSQYGSVGFRVELKQQRPSKHVC